MQLVNHVYRSLPQTPLIGGAASSVLQRQPQECLLGDHRRRSYGGEKGQSQVQVEVSGTSSQSFKEPGSRQQRLYKESGGSLPVPSRLKFRPLVSSKSTENFHHLRRVAMATVPHSSPTFQFSLDFSFICSCSYFMLYALCRLGRETHPCRSSC